MGGWLPTSSHEGTVVCVMCGEKLAQLKPQFMSYYCKRKRKCKAAICWISSIAIKYNGIWIMCCDPWTWPQSALNLSHSTIQLVLPKCSERSCYRQLCYKTKNWVLNFWLLTLFQERIMMRLRIDLSPTPAGNVLNVVYRCISVGSQCASLDWTPVLSRPW